MREACAILQILISHINPLSYFVFFLIRIWRPFFYHTQKSRHFIISVGNLTVGGTGKTPFCIWLANQLKKKYSVSVVNKNYRALGLGPHEVKELSSQALMQSGDEALVYKSHFFEDLSVFSGPKKFETLNWLNVNLEKPRVVIIDDGFQHTQVLPQVSILLIDLSDWWMWGVVPFGRAREWIWSIRAADAIVITKSHQLHEKTKRNLLRLIQCISRKGIPILESSFKTIWPRIDPETEIILLSGLANNKAFFNGARRQYSNQIKFEFGFSDHCDFDRDKMGEVFKALSKNPNCVILVTEKDAVKLRILYPDLPIKVAKMTVEVTHDELLWSLISRQNTQVV